MERKIIVTLEKNGVETVHEQVLTNNDIVISSISMSEALPIPYRRIAVQQGETVYNFFQDLIANEELTNMNEISNITIIDDDDLTYSINKSDISNINLSLPSHGVSSFSINIKPTADIIDYTREN